MAPAGSPSRGRRRRAPVEALVWRRQDIRESSRLITLLTREQGRITCLAKGAHRATSALLGRVDFLNLLEVDLAGRSVPLLGTAKLLHEPRGLRTPRRYFVASHLADVLDAAWLPDEPDPELFDLTDGMVRLAERAPLASLPVIVLGIELRVLEHLGQLAPLDGCSECGATGPLGWSPRRGGLRCRKHREASDRTAPAAALRWLQDLQRAPGRQWPTEFSEPPPRGAQDLLGGWLGAALERRTPLRRLALDGRYRQPRPRATGS